MLPKWHILIGFVFSYILVYFFNVPFISGLIIFISSWLIIDLDHYIYYIYKRKDQNFFRFYYLSLEEGDYYNNLTKAEKDKYKKEIFLFHGVEFWAILTILAIFNKISLFILLGFAIHMFADWADLYYKKEPFYLKISQIYTLHKNKNKLDLDVLLEKFKSGHQ